MREYFSIDLPWQENYIGCFSDLHIDSDSCALKELKDDLEYCKSIGANLIFNGDIFGAIITQDRKRYTKGRDIRDQDAQLNEMVDFAYDFLKPYADNILFIGCGNHETALIKYHGFDPILLLIRDLNRIKTNGCIIYAGYTGMFSLRFVKNDNRIVRDDWYYHHGSGGSAPVTKGMIDFNRIKQSFVSDVYWIGHKHNSIHDDSVCYSVKKNGRGIEKRKQLFFMTPGYENTLSQENYDNGYTLDWASESFYSKKPSGFALIRYNPIHTDTRNYVERDYIKRG